MDWRRAWSPLSWLGGRGYRLAGDRGSYAVAVGGAPRGPPSIALAPLDWPMPHIYRVAGRLYASPHPLLPWRGGEAVVRDPLTLEPVGLAVASPSGRRLAVTLLDGEAPPWGLLDPYAPAGVDPPARPALEVALDAGHRVVVLARSLYRGAGLGLASLPPAHAVAYAPCPRGWRWPGLAPALSSHPAHVRVCVEAPGPEALHGTPG